VSLSNDCPFWEDDGLCMIRDCSVCECTPEEVPRPWLQQDESLVSADLSTLSPPLMESAEAEMGQAASCEAQVELESQCDDRHETGLGKLDLSGDPHASWLEGVSRDVWTEQDDLHNPDSMIFVDLIKNPEGYTGYSGPSAARVWAAVHRENCFSGGRGAEDTCLEKRVFYRLISGLQASITTHVAKRYKFADDSWGPNTKLYLRGVGMYPDRLTNLYFSYLFVLRAIAKAGPILGEYNYSTDQPEEDQVVAEMMKALVEADRPPWPFPAASSPWGNHQPKSWEPVDVNVEAVGTCRSAFDESAMFQVDMPAPGTNELEVHLAFQEALSLRRELQSSFRNISRIMDCVGCEKCKMWGKLQTLGLGTALKILLTPEQVGYSLQRNEVIALVNTATQLARSVHSVQFWRQLELQEKLQMHAFRAVGAIIALILGFLTLRWAAKKNNKSIKKGKAKASQKSKKSE